MRFSLLIYSGIVIKPIKFIRKLIQHDAKFYIAAKAVAAFLKTILKLPAENSAGSFDYNTLLSK